MTNKLRQLYLRLRYHKQLATGFGLLSELGSKKQFVKVNDRLFVMNGHDPLVKVDLSSGVAEQYKGAKAKFTIYYSVKPNQEPKV